VKTCGVSITDNDETKNTKTKQGKPFTIEWLKMEDLEAGELKTDNYPRLELPSIPQEQIEAFSKMATIGVLIAFHRGVWTVSDEWNQLLPGYEFTKVEDLLKKVWGSGQ
jgi:hypothetical protein